MTAIPKRAAGEMVGGWVVNVQGNINVACPGCGCGRYLQTHAEVPGPGGSIVWDAEQRTEHFRIVDRTVQQFTCLCGFVDDLELVGYEGEGR